MFFDHFAKEHNIKDIKDWTKVKYEDIIKEGGILLLSMHDNSLPTALSAVYPEYKCVSFLAHKAKGYWDDISNHVKFFDSVANDMGLHKLDDWYQVKAADLYKRGYHILNYI
jgi:hypothetical protein